MTTETLKPRAKRLRAAVANMFNVTVTHSQSLELVAKEESFPNWDAACASYGLSRQHPSAAPATAHIRVSIQHNQAPSMATIFGGNESISAELNRLMDLADSRGALVLIAGTTGQGRTTTANLVMGELALERNGTRERLSQIEVSPDDDFPLGHRLKLMDEVRDDRIAFEAVALALAGVKVVAVIHATQGLDRLRLLLRRYGAGEPFLDRLLEDGQVISVQQELVWSDDALRRHSLQARQDEVEAAVQAAIRHDPEIVFMPVNK